MAIGVKESPSAGEVASWVIDEPQRILKLSGSYDQYLDVLRLICSNFHLISSSLRRKMATSVCFIGSIKKVTEAEEDTEAQEDQSFKLVRAKDVIVIDDALLSVLFSSAFLSCPQEAAIEAVCEVRCSSSSAMYDIKWLIVYRRSDSRSEKIVQVGQGAVFHQRRGRIVQSE